MISYEEPSMPYSQVDFFESLQQPKWLSVTHKAPAHRLFYTEFKLEKAMSAARWWGWKKTKCLGASQLYWAFRDPQLVEKDRKTAEIVQCLCCRRYLSKSKWRRHN